MEQKNQITNEEITIKDSFPKISKDDIPEFIKYILYITGIILICFSIYYLVNDVYVYNYENSFIDNKLYNYKKFYYVGGDAFNYIITATRSVSILLKSLIFAVLGCTSLILARNTPSKHNKK